MSCAAPWRDTKKKEKKRKQKCKSMMSTDGVVGPCGKDTPGRYRYRTTPEPGSAGESNLQLRESGVEPFLLRMLTEAPCLINNVLNKGASPSGHCKMEGCV